MSFWEQRLRGNLNRLNAVIAVVALILASAAIGCSSELSEAELAYNDGIASFEGGQYTEAITNFDRAIQIDPDFVDAYNDRGYDLTPENSSTGK